MLDELNEAVNNYTQRKTAPKYKYLIMPYDKEHEY
jgi:hypothetical protein